MKIKPEYAENIIVAVIQEKELSWYITDKEIWYMDYAKRIRQFEEKGYKIDLEYIDKSRKDLLILDSDNISLFKERISEYKVTADTLREYLTVEKETNGDWYYSLTPSLYVDFDNKILYSSYREMDAYENYVPNGWIADYKQFIHLIPSASCYWINNDCNYFLEWRRENGK